MTILEHMDSYNPCCDDTGSECSGAGANVCSRTSMVLTAAPLYELICSKRKGLSHRSASSSSAEKRASRLWSTEKLNIMISSLNCKHGGEICEGRDLHERQLNSFQLESLIKDKDYKVTPVGSPQNTCGPENCSAIAGSSARKEQISDPEADNGSNQRTTPECSKKLTDKYNCTAPCLGIVSSHQQPTLAKDTTPNICSASTSRAINSVLPTDVAIRKKSDKVYSQHRNSVGTFGSAFNYNRKAYEMKKDKEPVIYDVDDGRSSSNRRDNGRENFECISSTGIVSTVKRARNCDLESEKCLGGKRLKCQSNGHSSFMNWVATIINSSTQPCRDAPIECFSHPSRHISPLSISDKKGEVNGVSNGICGFKSIFQDMCQPGYNIRRNRSKYINLQKELVTLKGIDGEKQDNCAELMRQSRHIFPKNLWLGRFTHRLCSPSCVTVKCSEHRHHLLEVQTNRWSQKPEHNSVSHTEKSESKLQLTLSSSYCKISEPVSSTFAKRLGSLIHTTAAKSVDKRTCANKICLFCGMSDHSIRECTMIVETMLEHYLKTKPLYDRVKKFSCFCILCFHLDHWAASCPNVSSKGNQALFNASGYDDINFRISSQKHQSHHFANHDAIIMLLGGGKKDHHQVDNRSKDYVFAANTHIGSHRNESGRYDTLDLLVNQHKDATNIDKMKVTPTLSSQNEVRRSEFTLFSSHLSTKIASEAEVIFVVVRKLRLSRTDIIRWMESSTHINIIGFFLRLRIGKLEKCLGGTHYHVACITGTSSQRSIFVCVGSSTYTVTSRFISNQDFSEDELNTWWFQKLRDGTKMPSREEFNEQLQLREKFDF